MDIAALVLGGVVYLADPAEPSGRRWVPVPGLRSFYLLPRKAQQNQRQRWISALGIAGVRSGAGYDFPALVTPHGLNQLVEFALARFAHETGVTVARGGLIVTAHSGGGAALRRMLRHTDPDRIHVFDGLYGEPEPFAAWARDHIRRGAGALRVMFTHNSGTEGNSLALHRAISSALSTSDNGERLAGRFRVERTSVNHHHIPQRYGTILLADSAAELPEVTTASG